ncbi:MAG: mannitol dehydrogenase family protein, partial [Clostridiaceae bacterium]|nr:mannitol dehydrogenase family protein [Clostridiaceae bacterium]
MPYLSLDQLRLCEAWKRAGVKLPEYDVAALRERTAAEPIWVHFGPGNIFRGYVAALQQELLNRKLADRGIVVVDTWDSEASRSLEKAYDLLTLVVELHADGTEDRSVVASIA